MLKNNFLPFNFERFEDKILITNDGGDFYWLSVADFDSLLSGKLSKDSKVYSDLVARDIIGNNLYVSIDRLAAKIRSRKKFLYDFTSLHMLVTTVRCNQKCDYCQVSCEDEDAYKYDMDIETAARIVDMIFMSPSQSIKIEFQGGEPTLNWKIVEHVVLYALKKNLSEKKNLDFVLCSNLTCISDDKLKFLADNNVYISTSLDGPKDLHDSHRKLRIGESSYELFMNRIDAARRLVGEDHVDALMTTTRSSLARGVDIVDEYRKQGLAGVFLRSLNPYGFASEKKNLIGYSTLDFVGFFKSTLRYIADINIQGHYFPEYYASLLFSRMMTSHSTGFVDFQSPSGAGISGAIYDYNGDVYPADEGRMLARMGNAHFCMGNVHKDEYEEIFGGPVIRSLVNDSWLDTMPGCSSCVYKPYCGSDPIRNYVESGTSVCKQLFSSFCLKNKSLFNLLFDVAGSSDCSMLDVLWSWIAPKKRF